MLRRRWRLGCSLCNSCAAAAAAAADGWKAEAADSPAPSQHAGLLGWASGVAHRERCRHCGGLLSMTCGQRGHSADDTSSVDTHPLIRLQDALRAGYTTFWAK